MPERRQHLVAGAKVFLLIVFALAGEILDDNDIHENRIS